MNPVGKKYETGTSGEWRRAGEQKERRGERPNPGGRGDQQWPQVLFIQGPGAAVCPTLGPLWPSLKSLRIRKGGQPHSTLQEEAEPLPIPLKGLQGGATQQPACDIWALPPGMVPAPSLAGSHIREDEAPL